MRRVTGYLEYVTREGDTFDSLALQCITRKPSPTTLLNLTPTMRTL